MSDKVDDLSKSQPLTKKTASWANRFFSGLFQMKSQDTVQMTPQIENQLSKKIDLLLLARFNKNKAPTEREFTLACNALEGMLEPKEKDTFAVNLTQHCLKIGKPLWADLLEKKISSFEKGLKESLRSKITSKLDDYRESKATNLLKSWPFDTRMAFQEVRLMSDGDRKDKVLGKITKKYESLKDLSSAGSVASWISDPGKRAEAYDKIFSSQCFKTERLRCELPLVSSKIPSNSVNKDKACVDFVSKSLESAAWGSLDSVRIVASWISDPDQKDEAHQKVIANTLKKIDVYVRKASSGNPNQKLDALGQRHIKEFLKLTSGIASLIISPDRKEEALFKIINLCVHFAEFDTASKLIIDNRLGDSENIAQKVEKLGYRDLTNYVEEEKKQHVFDLVSVVPNNEDGWMLKLVDAPTKKKEPPKDAIKILFDAMDKRFKDFDSLEKATKLGFINTPEDRAAWPAKFSKWTSDYKKFKEEVQENYPRTLFNPDKENRKKEYRDFADKFHKALSVLCSKNGDYDFYDVSLPYILTYCRTAWEGTSLQLTEMAELEKSEGDFFSKAQQRARDLRRGLVEGKCTRIILSESGLAWVEGNVHTQKAMNQLANDRWNLGFFAEDLVGKEWLVEQLEGYF